jgi:hypothetical protein
MVERPQMTKFLELLGSRRFWQLTAGLALLILAYYSVIPQGLANLIAGYLGLQVVVGTADKLSK